MSLRMHRSAPRFATSPSRRSTSTRSKNFSRSRSTTHRCQRHRSGLRSGSRPRRRPRRAVPGRDALLRTGHRLVGGAARAEAVARRRERRVPVGLEHLEHRLLEEAVEHRRDAEGANAPASLGDLDPRHRLRSVGAVEQLAPDRGPLRRLGAGCSADGSAPRADGPSGRAAGRRRSSRRPPARPCCTGLAPAPSADCRARPSPPWTAPSSVSRRSIRCPKGRPSADGPLVAGLSGQGDAATASVPAGVALRASPFAATPKASSSWFFCRLADPRPPVLLATSNVRAFDRPGSADYALC